MKSSLEMAGYLHLLSPRIVIGSGKIQIHLRLPNLAKLIDLPLEESKVDVIQELLPVEIKNDENGVVIEAGLKLTNKRGKPEIIDSKSGRVVTPVRTDPKASLIQTLVQAEYWRMELLKEPGRTLGDLVRARGVKPSYVRRLLNAAYLAPAIKRAIFQGTQPSTLQVQDLLKPRSMDWNVQMKEMGFGEGLESALH